VSSRIDFYERRDGPTRRLGLTNEVAEQPVGVIVGSDAADSLPGQIAAIGLVNMMARVHRKIRLISPIAPLMVNPHQSGNNLAEALQQTVLAIDPFNEVVLVDRIDDIPKIGLGTTTKGISNWQIGASGSRAILTNGDTEFLKDDGSILGAALAACLGAAAMFRIAHGMRASPHIVSCWDLSEGPESSVGPLKIGSLDVGNVLVVGAGAVGSALSYWLRQLRSEGTWDVVDKDHVALDNTSRSLGMFAADAGWETGVAARKVDLIARDIGATPHFAWYDEWIKENDQVRPDLVLPLANERSVRHLIACRYDPIVLHATTSHTWQAQFHRHINGIDDCIDCRMRDVKPGVLRCSDGDVPTPTGQSQDAALPFLSAAAGLLLLSSLYRLAQGEIGAGVVNQLCLDLSLGHKATQTSIWQCREICGNRVPATALARIADGTRWAEFVSGGEPVGGS
jgi:molybdopterin/thiamine biosynthesis adenylyltransferase